MTPIERAQTINAILSQNVQINCTLAKKPRHASLIPLVKKGNISRWIFTSVNLFLSVPKNTTLIWPKQNVYLIQSVLKQINTFPWLQKLVWINLFVLRATTSQLMKLNVSLIHLVHQAPILTEINSSVLLFQSALVSTISSKKKVHASLILNALLINTFPQKKRNVWLGQPAKQDIIMIPHLKSV